MNWFTLTLLSAFFFATAAALTKKYFSDSDPWDVVSVRFVVSGLLLAPWVLTQALPPLDARFWGWVSLLAPLDVLALWVLRAG